MNIIVNKGTTFGTIGYHLTHGMTSSKVIIHSVKFDAHADQNDFDNITKLHIECENDEPVVCLPKNLRALKMNHGNLNIDAWPENLSKLEIENMSSPIISLPDTLRILIIGKNCEGKIDQLPSQLHTFKAIEYDHVIDFPNTLRVLHLGMYNHPFEKSFPKLKELVLGKYNHYLPSMPNLKRLLAICFDNRADTFNLQLKHLYLMRYGENFDLNFQLKTLSEHSLLSITLFKYNNVLELPNQIKHVRLHNMIYKNLSTDNLKSCIMQKSSYEQSIALTDENMLLDYEQLSINARRPWIV